jgi:hypothetical protein
MFYRKIHVSENEYIELSSRIHDGKDKILCSVVTSGTAKDELLSLGLVLSDEQLSSFETYVREARERTKQNIDGLSEA